MALLQGLWADAQLQHYLGFAMIRSLQDGIGCLLVIWNKIVGKARRSGRTIRCWNASSNFIGRNSVCFHHGGKFMFIFLDLCGGFMSEIVIGNEIVAIVKFIGAR